MMNMPWGLKRYHQSGQTHFITFSCYRRQRLLDFPASKQIFVRQLEVVRRTYQLRVYGFVVMPEHVHLLLSEPGISTLAQVLKALKQGVSRRLAPEGSRLWQARYYDMNVHSENKRIEKLRYIHRNPVKRGLCASPGDWRWSSFLHYATGSNVGVEIESERTARLRERLGITPQVRFNTPAQAKGRLERGTLK
jgi:putative transposase